MGQTKKIYILNLHLSTLMIVPWLPCVLFQTVCQKLNDLANWPFLASLKIKENVKWVWPLIGLFFILRICLQSVTWTFLLLKTFFLFESHIRLQKSLSFLLKKKSVTYFLNGLNRLSRHGLAKSLGSISSMFYDHYLRCRFKKRNKDWQLDCLFLCIWDLRT